MKVGRAKSMADAMRVLLWLQEQRGDFSQRTFAGCLGMQTRTAYRWLQTLEGLRLVEHPQQGGVGWLNPESPLPSPSYAAHGALMARGDRWEGRRRQTDAEAGTGDAPRR